MGRFGRAEVANNARLIVPSGVPAADGLVSEYERRGLVSHFVRTVGADGIEPVPISTWGELNTTAIRHPLSGAMPESCPASARSPARPILTLRGHTGWVRHGAYSRDDRHVLTASGDMTARLWDAATGEPQLVLTGHSGPVSTAEFSRDGRHAVTAGRDGTVLIHAVDPDILWEFGCELLRSVREHPDAPKTYVIPLLSKCRVPGESAAAPASVGAPQPMPAQAEP